MSEMIILVDENDNEIGTIEKLEAHKTGKLHRAFSIFVFNPQGEMLLHKRASHKYHSGGLWSNTCCSHPRKGESLHEAVHRRLQEEMGFDCDLQEIFHFIYTADLGELTEHELDHVFFGEYTGDVNPNPEEVEDYAWIPVQSLQEDIDTNPAKYTEWFKIAVKKVIQYFKDHS
ncbi:MAG: isopentenyl-diphosphate Delta-isomerase [Candidatus Methanofastidiosia archaeon]|jgi:isopentenyl-diphosphate delta-isomerase